MALPPGYQPHTDPAYAATYMWNPQTGDVRALEHVPAPPPPVAPASMTPPMPQAAPQAALQGVSYGTSDAGAIGSDQGHVFAEREKKIFIDLAKPNGIGDTTQRVVRLLPPWRLGLSIPYVKFATHMIPEALHPNPGDRKWIGITCYDTEGGPGNCPICAAYTAVIKVDSESEVKRLRPSSKYAWQGLDLENLNQHFVQRVHPATQQPEIGANGMPLYDIVPGIIKTGAQLWKAMRGLFPEKGDATHIDTGYAVKMKRTKTGPHDMNVDYTAIDLQPTPLDESLRPVLANLFDLQKEFIQYQSAEEMQVIANHVYQVGMQAAQEAAAPPQGLQPMAWPHAAPQAAPMPVLQYATMPPAHTPPPAPQAAPTPVAMPQPYAAPIPPPGAPGGVPTAFQPFASQQPVAHPGVPPTGAPAPGLPAAFAAPEVPPPHIPAAVPAPADALTGGQTPEEFEQSLPIKPGQAPF